MKRTVSLVLSVFVLFALAGSLRAQTPPPSSVEDTKALVLESDVVKSRLEHEHAEVERSVNHDASLAAHRIVFRRRVPDGFASLITAKQRDQVYKIQEEYHTVIDTLRARIIALEKERDVKVDGVLTDEQHVTLKKFREDAAARRRASGARATSATNTAE